MENQGFAEANETTSHKVVSNMTFRWTFSMGRRRGDYKGLFIAYVPLIAQADRILYEVAELAWSFRVDWIHIPIDMQKKLEDLERIINPRLEVYQVNFDSEVLKAKPMVAEVQCDYNVMLHMAKPSRLTVRFFYGDAQHKRIASHNMKEQLLKWDSFSRSQQLVIGNVTSWVKKQAWQDLANKISGKGAEAIRTNKVFLSYKRRSKAESVAETIAHRLSQQQIEVWFDKWEIKAGDSVAGKMGEGFKNCDACLIFLESQYSSSDWCTKEMNTALTKAIDEDFTIIPVLVEDCEKPELLKDLKPIYLKEPSANEFEQRLSEITDAIYRVDLNPYR